MMTAAILERPLCHPPTPLDPLPLPVHTFNTPLVSRYESQGGGNAFPASRSHASHTLSPALQVFCMFLFMAGASLFGVLLSQLNDILQNMSRDSRRLGEHLERYISFMGEYR